MQSTFLFSVSKQGFGGLRQQAKGCCPCDGQLQGNPELTSNVRSLQIF